MAQQIKLGDILGSNHQEDFKNFDLTEVQQVLGQLQGSDVVDLAHAELLQQQSLRGADILSEHLAKMVKTVAFLEAKVNSVKNKVSLEYTSPDGAKTTTDMKIWAGNSSKEVDDIYNVLAEAKGAKIALEKKFDILIKSHHHFKDIATGLRKTILGYSNGASDASPDYK